MKTSKATDVRKNIGQTRLGGEFWAGYVIARKIYWKKGNGSNVS